MGKFHQLLTKLSACHTSVFWFLDHNLSKYQRIYQTCYVHCYGDLLWVCFYQISSVFDRVICSILTELSAFNTIVVGYYHFMFFLFLPQISLYRHLSGAYHLYVKAYIRTKCSLLVTLLKMVCCIPKVGQCNLSCDLWLTLYIKFGWGISLVM